MIRKIIILAFPILLVVIETILRKALKVDSNAFLGPTVAGMGIGFAISSTTPKEIMSSFRPSTQEVLRKKGAVVYSKSDVTFIGIICILLIFMVAGWYCSLYYSLNLSTNTSKIFTKSFLIGILIYLLGAMLYIIKDSGVGLDTVLSLVFPKRKIGKKFEISFLDGKRKDLEYVPDINQEQWELEILKTVDENKTLSILEALKLFLLQSFVSVIVFSGFILIVLFLGWLGGGVIPVFSLFVTITQSTLLVLGGLLCFSFILRNTIKFFKFLIKRSQKRYFQNPE